jgi:hypothetical protein
MDVNPAFKFAYHRRCMEKISLKPLPNYFCILDLNNKYLMTLNNDGTFTSGEIDDAHRMDVIELEEWLKIIKAHNVLYKVTTITRE